MQRISYVQIDSANRQKTLIITPDPKLYNLPPYPLNFVNGSNKIIVNLMNHPFNIDDKVMFNNIVSKNVILQNIMMVKKNSKFVRLFHKHHGLSLYGTYDPTDDSLFTLVDYVHNLPVKFSDTDTVSDNSHKYYILRANHKMSYFTVNLSNIKGIDTTQSMIGNIPVNFLNKQHMIYLLFIKNGSVYESDPNSYLIMLEKKSTINYADGIHRSNTIYVKFNMLFNIPLNDINGEQCLNVVDKTSGSFTVEINDHKAIVDPVNPFYHISDFNDALNISYINQNSGGGNGCYVRKINEITPSYDINQYTYQLNKCYMNVSQIKLLSCSFPNSVYNIYDSPNSSNNKLYWRNLADGDHVYQLAIKPVIYSPIQLKETLESGFSKVSRFNGGSHIVEINLDEPTGTVTFSTFQKLDQMDGLNLVLSVPNNVIDFTTKIDLRSNSGTTSQNPNSIIPQIIKPFNPDTDELFIYFTKNSHQLINGNFPYAYNNLYKFDKYLEGNTFRAIRTSRKLLVNFHRTKMLYPSDMSTLEMMSINTTTRLTNFNFNHLTNEIILANHGLEPGDLIITDQFVDPMYIGHVYVYEVINVSPNDFVVKKIDHGSRYKFIYDSIIINFSMADNTHYWLDQSVNGDTLSFVSVMPQPEHHGTLKVYHPDHQLDIGDNISISNSGNVNGVPAQVINVVHVINKVVDDDHYEILLGAYTPMYTVYNEYIPNTVTIKYPDMFQLLFDKSDTFGSLLGFSGVTPYRHKLTNTSKMKLAPYNYFYICCPELHHIYGAKNVSNVFAVIYWQDGMNTTTQFAPTIKYFDRPIRLSELHISICHPDGNLVEFNGVDHSFVLEITELN